MENRVKTHCSGLTQKALSEAVFSGQILYFERLDPMADAVSEIQALLRRLFEPHAPESAHEFLQPEEYATRFNKAQEEFRDNVANIRSVRSN